MAIESKVPPKKQIRRFLSVIAAGVIFGFTIVSFFLYGFDSTGQYAVKNILISPSTLSQLGYSEKNPKTGGESRFVLSGIVQEQFNESLQRWIEHPISLGIYQEIYNLIQNDLSLEDQGTIEALFSTEKPLKMIIMVRTETNGGLQSVEEVFQEIQIIRNAEYYRIQLREDSHDTHWTYFRHQGIYDLAVQLFQEEQ